MTMARTPVARRSRASRSPKPSKDKPKEEIKEEKKYHKRNIGLTYLASGLSYSPL